MAIATANKSDMDILFGILALLSMRAKLLLRTNAFSYHLLIYLFIFINISYRLGLITPTLALPRPRDKLGIFDEGEGS